MNLETESDRVVKSAHNNNNNNNTQRVPNNYIIKMVTGFSRSYSNHQTIKTSTVIMVVRTTENGNHFNNIVVWD